MEPIIGDREKKLHTLEARKRDLLLRKNLLKDDIEIERVGKMLEDVEDLLKQFIQAATTTLRRRIKKEGEE